MPAFLSYPELEFFRHDYFPLGDNYMLRIATKAFLRQKTNRNYQMKLLSVIPWADVKQTLSNKHK